MGCRCLIDWLILLWFDCFSLFCLRKQNYLLAYFKLCPITELFLTPIAELLISSAEPCLALHLEEWAAGTFNCSWLQVPRTCRCLLLHFLHHLILKIYFHQFRPLDSVKLRLRSLSSLLLLSQQRWSQAQPQARFYGWPPECGQWCLLAFGIHDCKDELPSRAPRFYAAWYFSRARRAHGFYSLGALSSPLPSFWVSTLSKALFLKIIGTLMPTHRCCH